jgi:hypothetical protein
MNDKEIYRELFASLIKDSEAKTVNNEPYGAIHFPGAYRVLVDGNYETEFSAETDNEAIAKFKKYFDKKNGVKRYNWCSYDVSGNETDGWEVNDVSKFSDNEIVIGDDADDREVLLVLCAEKIFVRENVDKGFISVDNSAAPDYIVFTESENGKPIGRLELADYNYVE